MPVKWNEPISYGDGEISPKEYLEQNWTLRSDFQIAEGLSQILGQHVTSRAVEKKRRSLGHAKTKAGVPKIFADSPTTIYNDPPVIQSDNVLVMGDVEVPFHDADWCSDLVALAKYWGIKDLLLAGDFFHFESLSTWTPPVHGIDDIIIEFQDELDAVKRFANVLLENFDNILMIMGNHENRLNRRLRVHIRTNVLESLIGVDETDAFNIQPYYQSIIEASTRPWRIGHPDNYSRIPVKVASSLANKYQCNYVAAHGHDWGEATSINGYYAAACGCCADPQRLSYTTLRDNTRPFQQQGAFILKCGRPFLMHPEHRPVSLFMPSE